ncbi:M24 family metallopeptidase [Botrimarina hoheduenensis]|uniref:Putative peptidase n=1 Tax=Botrimarina hoheduenensis TaxID=2528000 RepID=A0A5C5VV75_9BACT|nr:Xaa-Pro peptidase family protein [Botrimarina hoheduenensis]TWT42556.1 putative peptidase [Botrimarina hoheduenensis]
MAKKKSVSLAAPHGGRIAKLRKGLAAHRLDALLVTDFTNVTYLTGFTGDDSYLLVTGDGPLLVTDPRYTTQLEGECPDLPLKVREPGELMWPTIVELVRKTGVERLGVEADSLCVGDHAKLLASLPDLVIEPAPGLVEGLRVIKDNSEVESIRIACDHARRAYEMVRAGWSPRMTEREIARDLEYFARRVGAQRLSFTAIIAAGPNAALPHARPTDAVVGDHPFTLIDWGVYTGLYASDLTRMVVTQKPGKRFTEVYQTVLRAQLAAIDAIRPGVTCEAVDAAARDVITKAGYGPKFGHGTGHGLGLEVHEAPRLSRKQPTELRPGMVVTVEPGIYLPGWGGVRIEDDILVTPAGHEVLSNVPKELADACL